MFLFFMLCLTVVAIALAAWIYLHFSRKALDGSVSADSELAGKPLVRAPQPRADAKPAESYPLPTPSAPIAGSAGSSATRKSSGDGKSAKPSKPVKSETAKPKSAPAETSSEPAQDSVSDDDASAPKGKSKKPKATKPKAVAAEAGDATSKKDKPKTPKSAAKGGAPKGEASSETGQDTKPKPAPEGPLFTAPSGAKDKLTDIKGVGPVAERQLNEQGITTFAQIAGFSAADIQRIDDYMPFSDRQIRDWQKQAKKLS